MKFNSCSSSRGDYPFTSISFGLGTSRFETMASSICMKVRKFSKRKRESGYHVCVERKNRGQGLWLDAA